MEPQLFVADGRLWRNDGVTARSFDPWALAWQDQTALPGDVAPVVAEDAVAMLAAGGGMRRLPVAVIGPREPVGDQEAIARALGAAIAGLGLVLLTGAKGGVMAAASRGAAEAGGLVLGLVPDEDWRMANPYVTVPLATGIGPVRNALIARASPVLVAVGGGYGTLSEIAYGLHFDKLVLTLADAPVVDGAVICADVTDARARIARRMLALDAAL
ncbi:DNA-binding protein [Tistrella sp. BH-R2-4]|uniref:DNA-binding protein n=1 Tax=Tistrella arctica TaxID=3133430 RepID=A0ABU9YRZ0_9PROT